MSDDAITRIDISASAANAGYLFNVGDCMLLFSTVAGTTVLATLVYGTSEFRPQNGLEAALQFILTVGALGYVPLVAWRGYARRYWRGHCVLGALLALGILGGIPAVLLEGWQWNWERGLAFVFFVALFGMLAAMPLGFALTARELLIARTASNGPLLVDAVEFVPDDVGRGFRRRKTRARFDRFGFILVLAGSAGIAAIAILFVLYGLADERDAALASGAIDLLGGLVYTLPVSAVLIALGRRLSQPDALRLLEADERAPILLLRAFADDAKQIRAKGLATRVLFLGLRGRMRLESAIADEIARLGPFIAIGQPGERLPRLGAARAYFSDHEWQTAVIDWIARARLIVMVAGRTPWVQWELREIVRAGRLGNLLLLFPPGDSADRRHRLDLVCEVLGDRRLTEMDADRGKIVAIRFSSVACVADSSRLRMTVVESDKATEVDYELGIRVANFG